MRQTPDSRHHHRVTIGGTLRRHRIAAAVSVAEAAESLGRSPRWVGQMEEGRAFVRTQEVKVLLEVYGAADRHLLELVDRTGSWWGEHSDLVNEEMESLLLLEDGATRVRVCQISLVPGLLQTESYARELMTTVSDRPLEVIERQAGLRTARRTVLDREQPLELDVVLDEAVLRRSVGGPVVMREQFQRLVEAADLPNVRIRVRLFAAGPHLAVDSTFHVFSFDNGDPPVVLLEWLDRMVRVEQTSEVDRYQRAFDLAVEGALDPEPSRAFLAELARG
ncbi:DUF5753 domain-containing protein [Herbidospora galbida]|nr:DUF5753 domain-containing protein [Herbidospora galbida]